MPLIPRFTCRILFVPLLAITHFFPVLAAEQQVFSLHHAQQQLMNQAWQLQAQQHDVDAWQQQTEALNALNLPRVDITVAGIAYEKKLDFYSELLQQNLEFDIDRKGIRSQLNLTWPLYAGGRIDATQQQSKARLSEAEAEQQQLVNQLSARLLEHYFAVQMLTEVVKVRQQTLQTLEAHVHRAKRFEAEGVINQLNRMQAEVAYAEARRESVQARRQLTDSRAALANLLVTENSFCLTTPLPIPATLAYPADWFVSQALQHNPALSRLGARKQQASQQLKIEQSKLKPEVFLAGSYDLNRSATPMTEPDWKVGLGVRWALTTDVERRKMVSSVQSRQYQLDALNTQAEADIKTGTEQAYRSMQQYQEQFNLLEQDITLARENARLQDTSFAAGLATSLDVTDARLKVSAAEVQMLQAAYGYISSVAALLEVSGQLSLLQALLPDIATTTSCQSL